MSLHVSAGGRRGAENETCNLLVLPFARQACSSAARRSLSIFVKIARSSSLRATASLRASNSSNSSSSSGCSSSTSSRERCADHLISSAQT